MRVFCGGLFISCLIIFMFTWILIFVPWNAHAETIKCYNNGQLVYDDKADYVEYNDEILTFVERRTGHQIYFFKFDCMIISDDKTIVDLKGEKEYAVDIRKESKN